MTTENTTTTTAVQSNIGEDLLKPIRKESQSLFDGETALAGKKKDFAPKYAPIFTQWVELRKQHKVNATVSTFLMQLFPKNTEFAKIAGDAAQAKNHPLYYWHTNLIRLAKSQKIETALETLNSDTATEPAKNQAKQTLSDLKVKTAVEHTKADDGTETETVVLDKKRATTSAVTKTEEKGESTPPVASMSDREDKLACTLFMIMLDLAAGRIKASHLEAEIEGAIDQNIGSDAYTDAVLLRFRQTETAHKSSMKTAKTA